MKLTISKSELQKGLTRIQSVVEKRNTMPILANALLDASNKKSKTLTLAATDLEVGIRGSHPANIETAGKITVSAKKLYEIVRELPDEKIALAVTDNAYVEIRCGRAQFTLAGNAADEYPTLPNFSAGKTAPVQALFLSEMIDRTMYAASADETRYNLNGVYFEQLKDAGKVRMVATDGHRLAIVDRMLGSELAGLKPGVIIPRKGLAELKRLLDEEDDSDVELGFEGNSGLVRRGDVTLVMRLIEGEFPNYQQVIPKETSIHLTVVVETLSRALRRVALLSAERSRAIKFELSDGQLRLSSNNPDLGDAQEELDVDYAGEPITVAFNSRYLMDALNSVKAKEVRLAFKDATSPAQLIPTDDDDALAVVMPMRV
ncbi:MAG: DNA polymerase III subunit beta [Deltaproteobacteria bacterium]|jgi:DNA polymerase-3 subunit beta|nr:DNA polymerase III subunit beta [Deltaproteobacteria bacterium]